MASTTKASSWGISTPFPSAVEKQTILRMCSATYITSASFSLPSLLLFLFTLSGCMGSYLIIMLMVPLDPSFIGRTALSWFGSFLSFLMKMFRYPLFLLTFISHSSIGSTCWYHGHMCNEIDNTGCES